MSKLYLFAIVSIGVAPSLARAAGTCHFEADTFQCEAGYVATSCITNGHFGVRGCTCCPEQASTRFAAWSATETPEVLVDGVCTVSKTSGTTSFPLHSEAGEKQALTFVGESGEPHRIELANNSETPFATQSLIQVAVGFDGYIKNPQQLCPTLPINEGTKCERGNISLYPPRDHFGAFDNTDGIAMNDYPHAYRKSLKASKAPKGTTTHFVVEQTIDEVSVHCELAVTRHPRIQLLTN